MVHQLQTEKDAIRFVKAAKFVLRYNSTPSLPLASMYAAAGDQRRAIELTNMLLARNEVVETNVIADRLILVHRDVVPALYALRVRFRAPTVSANAQRALELIETDGTATGGDVRRRLGTNEAKRPDAADLALAELQREMRIDRGPSSVPEKGIPYLSKEGFPYRIFEKAHADLVKIAKATNTDAALRALVQAAGDISRRKFASMFKLCLTPKEREEIQV